MNIIGYIEPRKNVRVPTVIVVGNPELSQCRARFFPRNVIV